MSPVPEPCPPVIEIGDVTVANEVEIKNDVGNPVPISGTVTITDGAGPITVDGTVTITDGSGPLTVDGTVGLTNDPSHLEDAVAGDAFRGTAMLGVRNDTSATTTTADGDYTGISTDASARLKINIDTEVSTTFAHGQNTDIDSGAAEQVVVASTPSKHGVLVKAMPGNTGNVFVGLVGVTTATGFPLDAGESLMVPVDDANKIYVIGSADNQAIAWVTA